MKIITNWSVVVLLSCFFSLNTYAQTEAAKVDSVYNFIRGDWYRVFACSGMTGQCDSISSDYLYKIERIAGTDSITWTRSQNNMYIDDYKYKISYSYSYLLHKNRWMLTDSFLRLLIYSEPKGFSCAPDFYDAGEIKYSHSKSTTGIVIQAINNSALSIFPNPTTCSFVVAGVDNVNHINVLDTNGRLLQSNDCKGSEVSIDISGFSKGIYFVQAISKSGIYTGKIIKN